MHTWLRGIALAGLGLALFACESGGGGVTGCEDADGDGVCDGADVCFGFDDRLDVDDDGTPDGCDLDDVGVENCGDAIDNDADGAADCADPDCADAVACAEPVRFGSLVGTVVDTAGGPLASVRVDAGGRVALTDVGGHFVLEDLVVPDGPTLVTFELGGYANFARLVEFLADRAVQTRVVLKATEFSAWWQDPTAGFTVTGPDKVRVEFPPGSLVDAGGAPITELVNVEIVTGDPTDPQDAPIMPGDYLSDEAGGTPLDSVAFFDLTVRTVTGVQVRRVDPGAPLLVDLRIPEALQGGTAVGAAIPWWSFDEQTGFWRREGEAAVFDDAGTLWTRAEVTHLSWWNCDRPVDEHGCVCVDVIDGAGDPVTAAQVVARGVTYQGTSSPVTTDADGRACITVKNSVSSAEQVEIFVQAGGVELPYPANPVDTPAVVASCLRDIGCPEKCDVLPQPITLDRSGVVSGVVTLRSGAPAAGLWIATDHASSMLTDGAGVYGLPVFVDIPFTVFTVGYTSPELLATPAAPTVVHDIALDNLPPELVDLSVNGVPQTLPAAIDRGYVFVYVADAGVPVQLDALAIDGDGDPIGYSWSGWCYDFTGGGGMIPLSCDPPDAPSTICDPPTTGGTDPPTQEGCRYILGLDDGYVAAPVEWTIYVAEGP